MEDPPHVIIFPFPAHGHVIPMLNLAELLSLSGIHVTFINAFYIHDRLLRHTNLQSRFGRYLGFRFRTIPKDPATEKPPHNGNDVMSILESLNTAAKPLLNELLVGSTPAVTCLIADGILSMALEVAEHVGIPTFHFRTSGACSFWAYFSIPQLIQAGELPFSGNDLDIPISNVRGMERYLRRRDLPSFCRLDNLTDPIFQTVSSVGLNTLRTKGLIFNTFEEIEGPILDQIRLEIPNVYTIGPLHAHLKNKLLASSSDQQTSNGLWEEDRSCLKWLDEQPRRSVLYVSFGSVIKMTKHQVTEFWHGLLNSGTPFLWVIRHDFINGDSSQVLEVELGEGRMRNGYIVSWAPQEEVLVHPSIGGFLTHSGWNSTLESIAEGVPMICWPHFADQQVNSRFVGEVWKLGLDMKDTCDRVLIQKMVRELMQVKSDEFLQRANEMAQLAKASLSEGGSSTLHLDRLIQDILLIHQGVKA